MTYYPVENDLIGGWDVSQYNKTVAKHDQDERTLGTPNRQRLRAERRRRRDKKAKQHD